MWLQCGLSAGYFTDYTTHRLCDDPSGGPRGAPSSAQIPHRNTPHASKEFHNLTHNRFSEPGLSPRSSHSFPERLRLLTHADVWVVVEKD